MSDCDTEDACEDGKMSWKPLQRQLLVCSGVWMSYFVFGLAIGAPTVIIPQIRREANSTETINDDMASWLTSAINFSGLPCILILTIMTRLIGRKYTFMFACADTFIAFFVLLCSTTVLQILICEIMLGFVGAAKVVLCTMIVAEYTSPKYRGLFLTMKCATFYWGIWAANALGTFFHWKKIGIVAIVCAAYTVATSIICPESPYWLASKGRYKQCAESHRWLKGCDKESEKELETLINRQKEYIKSRKNTKISAAESIKEFFVTITAKEFYKPVFISTLSGFIAIFSGKLVYTLYSIDILKKITGSDSTAYAGMLILDGITVTSMYVGCVLMKNLKRRVMLLVTSSIGVVFLFILSLYLYLIRLSVISENIYVTLSLLMLFSLVISCGPLILSLTTFAELIPLRSRNLAACILALIGKLVAAVTLKIAPYLFKAFGLHGTFLCFGISSSIVIILLYKYLPETKDKTLQEIADNIMGVTHSKSTSVEVYNLVGANTKEIIHVTQR